MRKTLTLLPFGLLLALLLAACQSREPRPLLDPTPSAATARAGPPTIAPARADSAAATARPSAAPAAPTTSSTPAGWTRFTTADGLPSNHALTIAVNALAIPTNERVCANATYPLDGSVWVGTDAGAAWWHGSHWSAITRASSGGGLASDRVQAFTFGPRLRVFFGTSAGLSTFCPDGHDPNGQLAPWSLGVPWTLPTSSIQAATRIGNTHWFGLAAGALAMYQGRSYNHLFTAADGLGAADVRALAGDQISSRIWVGTWGGGVTTVIGSTTVWNVGATYNTANSGLGSNRVTALAVVPQPQQAVALWVGLAPDAAAGKRGGVSRYDETAPSGAQWTTFSAESGALPSDDVRAVAVDKGGDVWVGTAGGLARCLAPCAGNGTWLTYTSATTGGGLVSDDVTGIAVAPDGTRWFSTGGGVSRLIGTPPPPAATATPTATALATQPSTTTPTATVALTPTAPPTRSPTPTVPPAPHSIYLPYLAKGSYAAVGSGAKSADHEGHERPRKTRKAYAGGRPFVSFVSFSRLSWSNTVPARVGSLFPAQRQRRQDAEGRGLTNLSTSASTLQSSC
ncbi:MAG: two-component regulator propeller domain-containing protein [Anaerolineae bacterium]